MKSKMKIAENGNKEWYNSEGQYHREDGPAIENANGNKAWIINGKFHREDGPALTFASGFKEWYINDVKCTEEEHKILIRRKKINSLKD
mgnify:CR=1 FL=1